jgi:hypothetical protein
VHWVRPEIVVEVNKAAVFVVREPLRQRHCDLRRILAFAAA